MLKSNMRFSILLISALFFTSCISSRKIDKVVSKYYAKNSISAKADNLSWFVSKPKAAPVDTISRSIRTKAQFIPALLYWQWHTNVNTSLSDQITVNRFNEYLSSKADSLELKKLIGNQKIEFSFEEIPNQFSYTHRGNTIILIFAYIISDLIIIEPEPSYYILNYKITDSSGSPVQEGQVSVLNTEVPIKNVTKSAKKFTWLYLDERHKHQIECFKKLISQVENALKD